ncbi:MAG: SMC family ATPase, partial [Acidobacteriota bacterium]
MRPLELSIAGFRSYDEPVTFDWTGRQLVGIVGPIGSGKSSILDAIAFALYGKTPTFTGESASLIRHGCDRARIDLTFTIDGARSGETWRVSRILRRRGANAHALSRRDGDGAAIAQWDKERDVTAQIQQRLGL